MVKPFIKWVGGKTQLLDQLKDHVPKKYNDYHEPFLGGGALFFALNPKKAYLNDINPHLIDLYQDVRDNLDGLILQLQKIEQEYKRLGTEDRKELYYEKRKRYNQLKEKNNLEKSALLIFLNKMGYNGMYRENFKGEFNIPYGRNGDKSIYNTDQLKKASKTLKESSLSAHPFDVVLARSKKDDFVYLDPPYWPLTKTANFTSYVGQDFVVEEQYILKQVYDDLTNRGVKALMSNSDSDMVKKLYIEYNISEVSANRFINCKPANRGKVTELLIRNY